MLTLFGSIAVSIMFLSYWLEQRSKWMVLVFAIGSGLTSSLQRIGRRVFDHSDRGIVGNRRPATVREASPGAYAGGA